MKFSIRLFVFFGLLISFCVSAYSQSVPSAEETQRVLNFYYNGKGEGIVLTESKICRDIHKSGAAKFDCKNEIIEFGPLTEDGFPPEIFYRISANETVYIWMSFLVPVGAQEKIVLRFNLNGETIRTSGELSIKGSIRYRTWTNFTPKESGDWEIEILHQQDDGPEVLASFVLNVE